MEQNYNDDAFGAALMACHKGETSTYLVERDDNLIEAGDLSVYFDTNNQKYGPDMEALSKIPAGSRVLDIGCGAGRHCLYLQERGVNVTGIDKSPMGIEVCKLRGVKDARVIPIEEMGEKLAGERFDAVIMLGHNFGLFGSFDRAKKLLGDLDKLTAPDAKIIATTRDAYVTTNPLHLAYHEWNRKRGRMGCQLRLRIRFKNLISSWLDYLFVSEEELKAIFQGTAWHVESIDRRFDNDGASYLMVLSK